MKEQQETNNASPAVPVNLQMWPSAPREKEKGRQEGGAGKQAARLPPSPASFAFPLACLEKHKAS